MTGDIWTEVRRYIAAAPVICFKTHPHSYTAAYWLWQLCRTRLKQERLSYNSLTCRWLIHDSSVLSLTLLMIGMLGGSLCGCVHCLGVSYESPSGEK